MTWGTKPKLPRSSQRWATEHKGDMTQALFHWIWMYSDLGFFFKEEAEGPACVETSGGKEYK